jgi:malonyl-CoA O-methyltransferase
MRFDPEALQNKRAHLDRVLELPWIIDDVLRRNLAGPCTWMPLERPWEPGGGSTLLRVETEGEALLLKVKHRSVWVESALECESGFPRKPSLANEHEFLTSLRGDWLPRLRFFDEEDDFQFEALEWLEPFESASRQLPVDRLLSAWQQLRVAVLSLFEQGVVHTDLHEGNLCLRGDQLVIVDFEEARRLSQTGPFEASLDACGQSELGNVGAHPEVDGHAPRWTCLDRLEQVFRERVRARLPELLERCSYDRDCAFNRDPLQPPDARVYQSVALGELQIEGQRPRGDRRLDLVCRLLRGLGRQLGPLGYLDVGSNLGAFCIAAAREPSVIRAVGIEAAPEFALAAGALAFVQGADAEFHVRVCGRDPIADEFAGCQVVSLLSVYHHLEAKDAFLADLARLAPEVVIAELATQDRFYPERGSLAAELACMQRTLGLEHALAIATSRDYARPLWVLSRRPLSRRLRAECRLVAADPLGLPRRAARRVGRALRRGGNRARRALGADAARAGPDLRDAALRAIDWLQAQRLPDGGLAVSDRDRTPYPEVTGYAIPTLHAWGRHALARELADWLVSIQRGDGAWPAPGSDVPYSFDVGQILKGLLADHARGGGREPALRRGCDWLLARIAPDGRVETPDESFWSLPGGRRVPDSIHLYALEPLLACGEHFGVPEYVEGARRALAHYRERPGLVRHETLSHFHAYVLEALVDLGEHALAREGLTAVAQRQRRDGSLPAWPDARWVCTPAVAQYAVAWYGLGQIAPAERALAFLCAQQRHSGGFTGSCGRGADYFPDAEISWAAKFFLDATAWHIRRRFDRDADEFPATVASEDARLAAVRAALPERLHARVLDAGCGRGRFARALAEERPDLRLVGVDLSDALLERAPDCLERRRGSLLDLPCADAEFDLAFCIEALEHVVDGRAAVRELARVARPGGTILIVDKPAERSGALATQAWERWPGRSEVESWLREHCEAVSVEDLDGPDLPEGLFVAWRGRVRGAGS